MSIREATRGDLPGIPALLEQASAPEIPAAPLASRLNEACQCIWVDRGKLGERLQQQLGSLSSTFPPSLVSGSVVFVDQRHVEAMDRTIDLITRAIGSRAFERRIAETAPDIAKKPQTTLGGVLGFDFHLGGPDPQLIEINTNPGGLLVSLEIARAATACCDCLPELVARPAAGLAADGIANRVVASFRSEWFRARGSRALETIAIVDDDPWHQYLLPEFLLYQRLLEQAGLRVLLVDPSSLAIDGDAVHAGGETIDLIYNRCTDFYLVEQKHGALRTAYQRDLAVVIPHPAAHARWADKRVLNWLRDDELLVAAALGADDRAHLRATIPATELVDPADADSIWSRRKQLFFKPVDGFGGKAAYRGDKITRKTFEHILANRYVAQTVAPTSSRRVPLTDGAEAEFRVDVRNFVMAGETWLRSARLYLGQTTNFRTAGGGFAPVLAL